VLVFVEDALDLRLHVFFQLDGRDFDVTFFIHAVEPNSVMLLGDLELNGVVLSGDGVEIKFQSLDAVGGVGISYENQEEEGHQQTDADGGRSLNVSILHFALFVLARVLDKQLIVTYRAVRWDGVGVGP